MADTSITVLRIVQHRLDGTISFDNGADLPGWSNGTFTYQVQAPFSPTEYTAYGSFLLPDGDLQRLDLRDVGSIETEVDGEPQTLYLYEEVVSENISGIAANDAPVGIKETTFFTLIEDDSVVPPMDIVNIAVKASNVQQRRSLSPDDKSDVEGQIQQKRDKSSANQTSLDFGETNYITVDQTSGTGQGEYKVTVDELSAKIEDDIGGKAEFAGYPTDGDSGITPQFAFGGGEVSSIVSRTVDNTDDSDFDKINPVLVPYTIQASGVWENAFQSVYPIGFGGINGTLKDTTFTQSIKAKTDGASFDVRTMYFIYSVTNGIAAQPFHTGAILNFATTEFSNQSKLNSVIEFTIDLSIDERIYTLTQVNGTIGTVGTAEIEDDSNTLSNWQLATSAALQNKIDKISNAIEDNLACQQADGGLKDCEIGKDDVARLTTDQTFTGIKTFDELLTALQGMNITGDVTIDGDLFILSGNAATEILTTELNVEDLVATYAKDNPTNTVQTGHEWELGSGTLWAITRDTDGEFRIGLTTDKKIIARIQDNPQEDLLLTYDTATKTLIERTYQDILDLMNIQTSDVEGLDQALLDITNDITDLENDKISVITAENDDVEVASGTKINTTGNISAAQDPTDPLKINFFVPTGGTGTGRQTVAEATVTPLTVTVLEQQLALGIKVQSDNTDVATIDAGNDRFQIDFTEIDGKALKYKFTPKFTFNNINTTEVEVDVIAKLDGVEDDRIHMTIPRFVNPVDGYDNPAIPLVVTTDPLEAQQFVTFHIINPTINIGTDLINSPEILMESMSIIGENATKFMFQDQYDANLLLKVDEAQSAESWEEFITTNPQDADRVFNKTGALFDNHTYKIGLTGGMTSAQMRVSSDNESSFNVVVDHNDNPALGTDYNNIPYIYALYDLGNTKFIIQSLDKRLETIEADLTSNPILEQMTELSHPIVATPRGVFDYRDIKGLSLENEVVNGDLTTSVTSDDTGTQILVRNDGTWAITGYSSTLNQTKDIISGNTYFHYCLLKPASVGRILNVGYFTSTNEKVKFGADVVGALELGYKHVAIANETDVNFMAQESTIGLVEREYEIFIDMTAAGIEDYTEAEMLLIAQQGYFEGIESVNKDLEFKALNTDTSYQIAKLNLSNDLRSASLAHDVATNGTVTRNIGVDFNDVLKDTVGYTNDLPLTNTSRFFVDLTNVLGYKLALNDASIPNLFVKVGSTDYTTVSRNTITSDDVEDNFAIDDVNNLVFFRVNKTTFPDVATWEAFLQANDVTFQFELDTPTTESYIETRESNVQDFEVATGVVVTQENTSIPADLDVEVSQTLKDTTNDNREQGNKNADAISKIHRDFSFTFVQATWENVLFAPKWSYTITDARILSKDEVGFAPNNDTEDIWNNALVFTQGVQDDIAGQAIFLARVQPTADVIGLILLKGVVVDG